MQSLRPYLLCSLFLLGLLLPVHIALAEQQDETPPVQDILAARALISDAHQLLAELQAGEAGRQMRALLQRAAGVIILPDIHRIGLLVGGEKGTGVILAQDEDGSWGSPGFVDLHSLSLGLQLGYKEYGVVLVVMDREVLSRALNQGLEFGGHISATSGGSGIDHEAISSTNLLSEVYYFSSTSEGYFAGLSFEGSKLTQRDDLTSALYGDDVTAWSIVMEPGEDSIHALELRKLLDRMRQPD